MTIEDQIAKLKSEIEVAKKALKEQYNDFEYGQVTQKFNSNILSSLSDNVQLFSNLSSPLFKKYGYVFKLIGGIIKFLK